MSSVIPQSGDTLSIPVWNSEQEKGKMTIEWKQMFTKRGDYYTLVAKDTSQAGGLTILFIQAEWYNDSGKNGDHHLSRLGEVKDGHVDVKLDGRFQYGQSTDKTMRFVVYHDQSRTIYQHRFKATSQAMKIGGIVEGIAKQWDAAMTAAIASGLQSYIGDKLHQF